MDNVKKIFGKGGKVSWLILGILGLLLIIGHNAFKDALYIVLGIGLIVAAAVGLYGWWKSRKAGGSLTDGIISAVMLIVGIWIVSNPGRFDSLINRLIGIALIIVGALWIWQGIKPQKDTVTLILGVIAVLIGVFVATTHAATSFPVIAAGVAMIYAAVTGYITEKRGA